MRLAIYLKSTPFADASVVLGRAGQQVYMLCDDDNTWVSVPKHLLYDTTCWPEATFPQLYQSLRTFLSKESSKPNKLNKPEQLMIWWFTFGYGHEPGIGYYTTREGTFNEAREKMNADYPRWAFQYASAEEAGVEKYNLKYVE